MLKLNKVFTVLLLSLISLTIITSESKAQSKVEKIDQFIQKVHKNKQFNGSVLVAEAGKVIYKKGIGYANMEWKIPNEVDTKFRLASVTKQFVAMVTMQLVQEGKLSLDGKITQYLTDYRKDTGDKVTIHHLLNHTSGIPSYTGIPGFWSDSTRNYYEQDFMVKNFLSGDFEFEPGSKYKYNNTGYYLLAVIIEKVTGKSWEDNLKERILVPLKMNNSGIDRNERIIKNKANTYMKRLSEYVNDPYFNMTNAFGAGDMYSTVEDLYKWDQALYSDKLISNELKKKIFTPYLNNYGYGWGVSKAPLEGNDSLNVVSHTGGLNGTNTIIYRLIDDKHLIVLLKNTGRTNLYSICDGITKILYDKDFELPKISIAETIAETIQENGIEAAIKQYEKLKSSKADEYNFTEGELNFLGYELMRNNKLIDAIEIFKLNVNSFPEAFNPYDSLGEAYMVNGERGLAIKNYKKSLELNPKNENAVKMLKDLEVNN